MGDFPPISDYISETVQDRDRNCILLIALCRMMLF